MGLRECDKCGQMVDEAKAFCPSCDNVFVTEEQRGDQSKFERLDKTVQLGNTMYDMMLSDMGLNISKPAPKPEKRVEVIAPIQTAPAQKVTAVAPEEKTESSWTLWIVLGVIGLLILLPFAAVSVYFLIRAVMARY